MKKIFLLFIFLLSAINLVSCSNNPKSLDLEENLNPPEVINEDNRKLIGTEVIEDSGLSKTLENDILISTLFYKDMVPPNGVAKFTTINNITPEILMTNGNAAIFTQNDGKGWACKKGDQIIYEFKKYPSQVSDKQTLIIGYVLDDTLYPGEEFKELDGKYALEIEQDGEYYIYTLSATSDYLALHEGVITTNGNSSSN